MMISIDFYNKVRQEMVAVECTSALNDVIQAINSTLDLDEVLQIVMDTIIRLMNAERGLLMLRNEKGEFVNRIARNWEHESIDQTELAVSRTIIERVVSDGQPVITTNAQEDPRFGGQQSIIFHKMVSILCVPLKVKGNLTGVIYVDNRVRTGIFSESERDLLTTFANHAAVALENAGLYENLQRSNKELMSAYDTTLEGWSRALDMRDKDSEGHTQRVTEMTVGLARFLGMTENEVVHIRRGALLHDMGKMGIPDKILLKPAPLTDEEMKIMRSHPLLAFEMLAPIEYLKQSIDIPYCHHEKWDGSGYPRGIKGEQIPVAARIFTVVDVFDALTSDRPYRKAWTRDQAISYLLEQSGSYFDPDIVNVFLEISAGMK